MHECRTVLDFGCGDLSLAKALRTANPALTITAVDIVDSGVRADGISFSVYDGVSLPFRNNAFDITVAYHVFHHSRDPRAAFGEVVRVTKKTILVVEPVYRRSLDLFFMKILDRVGNGWRGITIPMPFTFQTEATWRRWAREYHRTVAATVPAGVLPGWLPFGETKLFTLTAK